MHKIWCWKLSVHRRSYSSLDIVKLFPSKVIHVWSLYENIPAYFCVNCSLMLIYFRGKSRLGLLFIYIARQMEAIVSIFSRQMGVNVVYFPGNLGCCLCFSRGFCGKWVSLFISFRGKWVSLLVCFRAKSRLCLIGESLPVYNISASLAWCFTRS